MSEPVIVFCPKCRQEAFEVTVTSSGSQPREEGVDHWFCGDGHCTECGHEEYYCDGSL
jgi:hypothetical protein